jgi:hypothetical protein
MATDSGKKLTHDQSWGNFGQPQNQPESPWKKFEHVTMPWSNFHSGGKVRKTGFYKLKKGEVVLTVAQQKAVGIKHGKKKSSSRKRVAGKK